MNEKKPQQARQRLEVALSGDPKNADIMTALADLAVKQGQQAAARNWLEQAAKAQPDELEYALRLARFYASSHDTAAALTLSRKLLAAHPNHPEVLALTASLQYQAGNEDAALDNWTLLAKLLPESAEIQWRIAEVQQELQQPEAAQHALRKALSVQPDFPQAQTALVRLQLAQHDYVQAMQTARSAQKGGTALGYKLEADVLMAQKQPQTALPLYQQAFEKQPSAAFLVPLHSALVQSGKSRDADTRMQQWLDSHRNDLVTRLYYANSLMAEQNFAASATQFELALKQSPAHVAALNNLAWLYQQLHDARALATAEQAHKLAPHDAAVLDTLGWILAERGQRERALPLLQEAATRAPANADIRQHYDAVNSSRPASAR